MSGWNHWQAVVDGLKAAQGVGILTTCTCGAPEWEDGPCGHCRLEAAQEALSRLWGHCQAQDKVVAVLRGRGAVRTRGRQRLNRTFVTEVEGALDDCRDVELRLEQLTDALSVVPFWETDEWLEEGITELIKEADLDGEGGPWAWGDDRVWERGEGE